MCGNDRDWRAPLAIRSYIILYIYIKKFAEFFKKITDLVIMHKHMVKVPVTFHNDIISLLFKHM